MRQKGLFDKRIAQLSITHSAPVQMSEKSKNTTSNPERIGITKFCSRCGKRPVHKETK